MRLYEFEGIELFRKEGIPVPDYALASSAPEAKQKAKELGLPVVIKAQVLVGGRWLAGGVKTAETLEQVENISRYILSSPIRGFPVRQVMVAKKVDSVREFYLGVTVDGYNGTPVVILSTAGGVTVEEAVKTHPEFVISRNVSISGGLPLSGARQIAREVGLDGGDLTPVAMVLHSLYNVFRKYDAMVAEINPLIRTPEGTYAALDSKVELDDSSLYRHPDLHFNLEDRYSNPLELKGRQIGVTYVELDGDIAIIASGAGLGMATMDIISQRLRPANFLETGGAITADLLYQVMDLVLQKKGIRAVFINVYGGINPIHEGAKGVAQYLREHKVNIPIVAKALGNHQEETWEVFKQSGVHVVDDVSTEKGADLLIRLLEGKA